MAAVRKNAVVTAALLMTLLAISAAFFLMRRDMAIETPNPAATDTDVGEKSPQKESEAPKMQIESPIRFASIDADDAGLQFDTEQNGTGVSIFDYDGDEQPDLFFVNGSQFEQPAAPVTTPHHLYRSTAPFRFQNTTVAAGLQELGGQGCAAADYDNDGFTDLFVANYGRNRLWHNNGDGTFTDVTAHADVGDEKWAAGAAFADLDGDGNPDLYVVNYMDWSAGDDPEKRFPGPTGFDGLPDLLYRNTGDGRFEEIGTPSGISVPIDGNGLAIGIGDLNQDSLPDIYIANDASRNFLFRNLGGMKFEEIGVPSGVAVSQNGTIGSGMGVGICDYNHDTHTDLFCTNFYDEVVDAFTNMGDSGFLANNAELGIDAVSRHVLNFGIIVTDMDLDLWPDLFFANGHLWEESGPSGEYKMYPSLLRNDSGNRFVDVAPVAGEYFEQQWLGRAAAMGDLDNDGDTDLVITHLLDPPVVLKNDSVRQGNSRRVTFIGTESSRQPLGCEVRVRLGSGQLIVLEVPSGGSFQVSHDPVLVVPVGQQESGGITEISITWSSGITEVWHDLPAAQTLRLIEGTGVRETKARTKSVADAATPSSNPEPQESADAEK